VAERSIADYGAVVVTRTLEEAVAIANRLAPEHLELMVRDAARWVPALRHAGAIFVGAHTPEAFGDYLAGRTTCCRPAARRAGRRRSACTTS
jgi:histidinol dehydrogenase